jgi:EAL domain-containing protein (putative c-di-GMP-specific phosphodiesterase class I)
LAQVRAWQARGRAVPVAVNLSPSSLEDPNLADEIGTLLRDARLESSWLEVDITESATCHMPDAAITTLERLRAMGIRVAIDDFGTGYSSLSYLTQLPVDELKIDHTFVRTTAVDDKQATIVRSMIDLGHNLGLEVVAEGLEDELTRQRLVALGCDLAQGFYLSRPAPSDALTALLASAFEQRAAAA